MTLQIQNQPRTHRFVLKPPHHQTLDHNMVHSEGQPVTCDATLLHTVVDKGIIAIATYMLKNVPK